MEAQDKLLQATEFKKQANEASYETNKVAVSELLKKLRDDDPDLASDYEDRLNEYSPLKNQIRNLRDEANSLSNKGAKLGAISNVEDKELELLTKQSALLSDLKRKYPNYVVVEQQIDSPEKEIKALKIY